MPVPPPEPARERKRRPNYDEPIRPESDMPVEEVLKRMLGVEPDSDEPETDKGS